jgi:hypothetical protein
MAAAETIAAAAAKRPTAAVLPAEEEPAAAEKHAAAEQSVQAERGLAPDAWQRRALPQHAQATQPLPAPAHRTRQLRVAAAVLAPAAVAEHAVVAERAADMAATTRNNRIAARTRRQLQ